MEFSQAARIPHNETHVFHAGYLFLQELCTELRLDNICRVIKSRHKYKYDLHAILTDLVYARILSPSSKLSKSILHYHAFFEKDDRDIAMNPTQFLEKVKTRMIQCVLSKRLLLPAMVKLQKIYRLLEKKIGCKYTAEQIIETLSSMKLTLLNTANGYVPAYTRTEIIQFHP